MKTVKLQSLRNNAEGITPESTDFLLDDYGRLELVSSHYKCVQDVCVNLVLPVNPYDPLIEGCGSNLPYLIGMPSLVADMAIFLEVETLKVLERLSSRQQSHGLPPDETLRYDPKHCFVEVGQKYTANDYTSFAVIAHFQTMDGTNEDSFSIIS